MDICLLILKSVKNCSKRYLWPIRYAHTLNQSANYLAFLFSKFKIFQLYIFTFHFVIISQYLIRLIELSNDWQSQDQQVRIH